MRVRVCVFVCAYIYLCTHICIYVLFTNPSARAGYDTRSIFNHYTTRTPLTKPIHIYVYMWIGFVRWPIVKNLVSILEPKNRVDTEEMRSMRGASNYGDEKVTDMFSSMIFAGALKWQVHWRPHRFDQRKFSGEDVIGKSKLWLPFRHKWWIDVFILHFAVFLQILRLKD